MHRSLVAAGLKASLVDVGDTLLRLGPEGVAPIPPGTLPPGAPAILHVNAPFLPQALRRLGADNVSGRLIVGYWAWELPVVPAGWRRALPFVHEIWTPSTFSRDALANLVDARPVTLRVVPHPVADSPPDPAPLDRAAFGLSDTAIVVLVSINLASSFVRKNPLGAIAAFRAAFGDRDDRVLVLKIGNAAAARDDFTQILEAAQGAPNIHLETRPMSGPDSHALTRCADIVLSLHRSEGFGLVPAEAMLLGRPVVATGWSGNMDFMDHTSAALVDYRLVPAADPRGVYAVRGAVWAEPDIASAAAHLVRLAGDRAAREALGALGQRMARDRLGAAKLLDAVRALRQMKRV
jgi:glycosyltransferase involved in cell wall biosynthesis